MADEIDWKASNRVFIASSSYDHKEGEVATIQAIQNRALALSEPLSNFHHGSLSIETAGDLQVS